MNFVTPLIINEHPSLDEYKTRYSGFERKLAYRTAVKVYWRTVLSEAQNHRCCWCGVHMTEKRGHENSATIEHITPRSCGGPDDPSNYAVACDRCNNRRKDQPWEVFIQAVENRITILKVSKHASKETKQELYDHGLSAHDRKKPCRLKRNLDQLAAMKAVKAGEPNTFEEGSRAYRFYERYAASPNFGKDMQIS